MLVFVSVPSSLITRFGRSRYLVWILLIGSKCFHRSYHSLNSSILRSSSLSKFLTPFKGSRASCSCTSLPVTPLPPHSLPLNTACILVH
ncbi:hypothetical protein VKT23_006027 [Stygiomarasmius scandens]|uniref:Secreted protein n=1 Tax=Marasmiellus scandens TaxID=2682957 RepID=A0ABR1JUV1_9AGAR